MITKETVAEKIGDVLQRRLSLLELVDWAEDTFMDAPLDERDAGFIADILARLGLGDVKPFSLTWEDCYDYLRRLGYEVGINVKKHAAA